MVPTSTPISLRFNDGFLIHLCNGCAKSVHLPKHRLPVSGSEEAVEAIHNFLEYNFIWNLMDSFHCFHFFGRRKAMAENLRRSYFEFGPVIASTPQSKQ
jgi:hypothetical protein